MPGNYSLTLGCVCFKPEQFTQRDKSLQRKKKAIRPKVGGEKMMGGDKAWIFPGHDISGWMEQEKQGGFREGLSRSPAKVLFILFSLENRLSCSA